LADGRTGLYIDRLAPVDAWFESLAQIARTCPLKDRSCQATAELSTDTRHFLAIGRNEIGARPKKLNHFLRGQGSQIASSLCPSHAFVCV
jgi:hypothetical protein